MKSKSLILIYASIAIPSIIATYILFGSPLSGITLLTAYVSVVGVGYETSIVMFNKLLECEWVNGNKYFRRAFGQS